ncbi:hypothetical protein As57867_013594, partial [Aphanomyces stellatus]
TPLPFCDLPRATRVLAASLARGLAKTHPGLVADAALSETDWLVALAHCDVDPIAVAASFHAYLGPASASSPALLRQWELMVARGLVGSTPPTFQWFHIQWRDERPRWRAWILAQLRHHLWQAFPADVVFCNNQVGVASTALAAFLAAQAAAVSTHSAPSVVLVDVVHGTTVATAIPVPVPPC